MTRIFNPAIYPRNTPHTFWAPLVGLFTGCRASEICQTRVQDFKEVDGILCVKFTSEGSRQSVKSASSERLVPLHPKLRALGLERYIEDVRKAGGVYLFEYLGNNINGMGDAAGKSFGLYIRNLGIEAETGRKTLHSFRDTVINEMKRRHVAIDKRRQFSGHADDSVESESYTNEFEQRALAEFIHPVLSWSFPLPAPYQSGEFLPFWIKAQANAESDRRHQISAAEREKRNGKKPQGKR
jgi:integrase